MVPETIKRLPLALDKNLWQVKTNAEKDENSPLPSERIKCDAKGKPPQQFEVREKVKRASRAILLQELGHVNPALHPERARSSKRVDEEHE